MRELPAAVLVSVVVHAAAIVYVASRDDDPDEEHAAVAPAPPPPTTPELLPEPPREPEPEPEPIELVVLDAQALARVVALAELPPLPIADRRRSGATIAPPAISSARPRASGEASDATAPASGEQGGDGPRTSLMTMRKPPGPTLKGPSGDFMGDFLARSKPLEPIPDIPLARIDAELAELRARARRGEDVDRTRIVALLDARRNAELQPIGHGRYAASHGQFTAVVDRDGKTRIKDRSPVRFEGGAVVFDTTDVIMRGLGQDPYAREKLKFLDRTRDQRAAVTAEYRREQLARSTQIMQGNIDRLWAATADLAKRKQGLFELWDECAETGDRELVAGAADARKAVTDFIKLRLTGAAAYTADELARLNAARHSTAPFAPYQ